MKKAFKWILAGGALCAAIAGIIILTGVFANHPQIVSPAGSSVDSSLKTKDSMPAQTDEPHTAKPLADFLNENHAFSPYYEISDTKTMLYQYRRPYYDTAVYDSSTGILSDAVSFDMKPQCRENGFWVLKSAESSENAMRYMGENQSFGKLCQYAAGLLMYDYDMNLIADVDLSGYGTVNAIEADLKTKSIFCILNEGHPDGEDSYLYSHRLVQRSANSLTETELYTWSFRSEQWTPHTLGSPSRMILSGDSLMFTAYSLPERSVQNNIPAWGVFNCQEKKMQLNDEEYAYIYLYPAKDCVFVVCLYDENIPNAPYFVKRVLSDGTFTDYQIHNPMELSGISCRDLHSGKYFATMMRREQNGGEIARISVYNETGEAISTTDLTTDSGKSFGSFFMQESTRTVYVQDSDGWQTVTF